jgi:choline dehydrogenase-like flavoprotein
MADGIKAVREDGSTLEVRVKEVIVSGGAFSRVKTPNRSGTGEPADLEHHGIPTLVHLTKVAENFMDQRAVCPITIPSAP